jgi:uroporphyrinogen-III decarboxylase
MEKEWTAMTPEEKREVRFKSWLEAEDVEFISPEAKKAYRERVTRLIKVIKLEEPDRVPIMMPGGAFPAYYAGANLQKAMYDYDELVRAWRKFHQDFDMDTTMVPSFIWPGKVFDLVDYRLMKWPGHGVSSKSTFYQYVEGEYMKADEYDALLNDQTDFWLRTMMPRITGALEPLQYLSPFNAMSAIPVGFIAPFARKDVQDAFKVLMEAGEELQKWAIAAGTSTQEILTMGFPPFGGIMSMAPFDVVGDFLRGTHGIMLDMYRQPDKIHEVLEKITPSTIEMAVDGAATTINPIVLMPLHKGDDSFMSQKQFETFYWPTLREVMLGLIEEGLVPMPLAEGFYNNRLETITDIPRGAVIWWFERADIYKAKEIVGGTACIAGGLPLSLVCTGTPQEVKEYCRNLIEVCGKGGGYLLSTASSVEEATAENLHAIMEAAKEYGVYK